jgi:predicted lipoprotein with Yx(FWY)xxD motif
MLKLSLIIVRFAIALLLAGCGSSSTTKTASTGVPPETIVIYKGPAPASETRHVIVAELPHLGMVLVDGKSHPLYVFVPDKPGAVCTGSCAAVWPPFQLTHGKVLDTSPALEESLIAIEPDPEGGRMVKFGGWLLHNYTGDTSPGVANGQGLSSDGGHWYVISTSGKLVTTPG